MIFEQLVWSDLGCASYLVGCQQCNEAVVVDPPFDIDQVLALCARHGARLTGVIETHTHADHLSGHGRLAAHHGCFVAIHESAGVEYPNRPLRDGERIQVGNIAIDVLHTPGHRPEHCALAVSDLTRADEPWLLLSGDALFVGDTGRPDLAVGGQEGAAALYRSLHERLGSLADSVELFPGHVAGSLCGRGMSAKPSSTLGYERRFNPMLAGMPAAEFIERANAGLAPKPPTMGRIVELNRGPFVTSAPVIRSVKDAHSGDQVLDLRDGEAFAGGHLPGSLNVPVSATGFGNRCGFVFDPASEVVLIADGEAQAALAARRLAAVGFLALAAITFGSEAADELERFEPISLGELGALAERGELQVVDLREPDEQTVMAAGAIAIPYRLLQKADLSMLDAQKPTAAVCQTGARSPLGASLLAARGFTHVRPVLGAGMSSWSLPS